MAEGFERIHRQNLVGMGVLPLQFQPGTTRKTLAIDGTETFSVRGTPTPGGTLTLVIERTAGEQLEVPVTCRLDSDDDVTTYTAGGILPRFSQEFLAAGQVA